MLQRQRMLAQDDTHGQGGRARRLAMGAEDDATSAQNGIAPASTMEAGAIHMFGWP
jgi:hypothetical protein